MAVWGVAEAEAQFGEVLDKAESEGPQLVTRRGREFLVVAKNQSTETRREPAGVVEKPFVSAWDALRPPVDMQFDYDFPRLRSKGRAAKF